jgi:signal transduction histidine kinase/CheY-like chemotaxis protein
MKWKLVLQKNYPQLIFVFTAFLLMLLISYFFVSTMHRGHLTNGANEVLRRAEENIRTRLGESEATLISAVFTIKNMIEDKGASQEDVRQYMISLSDHLLLNEGRESISNGVIGFVRGDYLDGVRWKPDADYAPRERPWYVAAIANNGAVAQTSPYVDAQTKSVIISFAQELYSNKGESLGVIALDVMLTKLSEYVASLQLTEGGYGMILNEKLDILAHPDKNLTGSSLASLASGYAGIAADLTAGIKVSAKKIVDRDDTDVIVFFKTLDNGWRIGIVTPVQSYYSELYYMATMLAIFGITMACVLSYILLRLSAAKLHSDEENRYKSDFLARMSHEIRTPMNAIIGLSELGLRSDNISLLFEYFTGIKQAGHNLLSIINDILDVSKIESGNLEIQTAPYIFASLLNDVLNMIRVRLAEKPILFTVNISAALPNDLIGDETRVRQILINLLSNAVKYTNEGHIMFIVTGERTGESSLLLKFEVSDSGIGIKAEDMTGLFGDFVRLDGERNKGVEGTGLGLAITKKLCLAMGGDVTVSSVYGQGSVFTASIPQTFENDLPLAAVENREEKRILFYDERPLYAESTFLTLEDLGVEVTVTTEAEEFFSRLSGGEFNFAFVSPKIAEQSRNFIREKELKTTLILLAGLGELSSFQDIPVIVMPAYAVPIANALNYDPLPGGGRGKSGVRFVAPEARVLLVDDILTNLVVAKGLLAPYSMEVDICTGGEEALTLVKEKVYDLVFMDHMMPGLDGIETTTRLRGMKEGEKLPIVALTANAVSGMREMFLQKGMDDFLSKPIDPTKLDALLKKWIPADKRRNAPPDRADGESGPEDIAPESALPEIAGVDVAAGIARIGGSQEHYLNLLEMFRRDAQAGSALLEKEPDDHTLHAFVTRTHGLKTALANIGAMALSQMAALLEKAGREGDRAAIRDTLPQFREELAALTARIGEVLAGVRSGDGEEPGDPTAEILARLLEALEAKDIDAIYAELPHLQSLPVTGEQREAVGEIVDFILTPDFQKAAEAINALLGSENTLPASSNIQSIRDI